MSYLLNAWSMAGWAEELAPGSMLARTLMEQPVLLFRDADGQARALHDRCPHRFAPLWMGRLSADGRSVQCGYHGLQFDGTGACVHTRMAMAASRPRPG